MKLVRECLVGGEGGRRCYDHKKLFVAAIVGEALDRSASDISSA